MHAHDQAIVKILREFGREDLSVITGMDFGHKSAIMTMPFGMKVEINPQDEKLVFLESGVISA
jgi:muramoyltetrapeptide carboxypeptidase LdcA involved in peptidoglycan recycling